MDKFLMLYMVASSFYAFVYLFTGMGLGADIFVALHPANVLVAPLLACVVVAFFTLYLFDASYWKSTTGVRVKRFVHNLQGLATLTAVILSAKQFPASTLMVFFIGVTCTWPPAIVVQAANDHERAAAKDLTSSNSRKDTLSAAFMSMR